MHLLLIMQANISGFRGNTGNGGGFIYKRAHAPRPATAAFASADASVAAAAAALAAVYI